MIATASGATKRRLNLSEGERFDAYAQLNERNKLFFYKTSYKRKMFKVNEKIKLDSDKKNNIYFVANLVLLFLLSMHVGGYSAEKTVFGSVISILFFVLINRRLVMDFNVYVLSVAVVSYGFIFQHFFGQMEYWSWWNFSDAVLPMVFVYIACRQLSWNQCRNRIGILFLCIGIGTFFYSILNHWVYLKEGFLFGNRIWNDFWTHTPYYATEFSYWGVFIVGLIGYVIYCFFEKKWIRGIIICLMIGVENYIQIVVDNRMVLMVTVVAAGISVLLYIYLNRKEKKRLKLMMLILFGIIVVACGILLFNIGNIKDSTYYQHFVSRNGGIIKNIRFQMIWDAICLLPSHWKGGGAMYTEGYSCVHNYWLQVANDTGIFPFIFWMIFNISACISLFKLIRNDKIDQGLKYMVVPMIGAVVSYLMMEIGGQGKSDYIVFYVILVAFLHQLEKNEEKVLEKH